MKKGVRRPEICSPLAYVQLKKGNLMKCYFGLLQSLTAP